jgi:hypothetical protein
LCTEILGASVGVYNWLCTEILGASVGVYNFWFPHNQNKLQPYVTYRNKCK